MLDESHRHINRTVAVKTSANPWGPRRKRQRMKTAEPMGTSAAPFVCVAIALALLLLLDPVPSVARGMSSPVPLHVDVGPLGVPLLLEHRLGFVPRLFRPACPRFPAVPVGGGVFVASHASGTRPASKHPRAWGQSSQRRPCRRGRQRYRRLLHRRQRRLAQRPE